MQNTEVCQSPIFKDNLTDFIKIMSNNTSDFLQNNCDYLYMH